MSAFQFAILPRPFLYLPLLATAICKPRHWNLGIGIGIGIGTDTTNAIISSSIRLMDTKPSWVMI